MIKRTLRRKRSNSRKKKTRDNRRRRKGWTTHYDRVVREGLKLPPVDRVRSSELPELLDGLIQKLGSLRVFLLFTDHLSDRALYKQLTEEALRDPIRDIRATGDMAYLVGLIGGRPEHLQTYLKYYAGEEDRREMARKAPTMVLPPRENPPYDRDRFLPRPDGWES